MAIGCGAKCAKVMLIVFNLLFWLAGGAILGFGIWMVVDSNVINIFNVVNIDPSDPNSKYAAYLFIAVGGFIVLVAFLGCCGAMQESKCMLVTYFLILLLVFAGLLAAGILAIIFYDKMTEEMRQFLDTSLTKEYGRNESIRNGWDYIQFTYACCGYNNPEDYSRALNWKSLTAGNRKVPDSCCRHTPNSTYLKITVLNMDDCQRGQNNMRFQTGCHDFIKDELNKVSAILIGLAFGIAGLVVFGMIFSICLCRNIGEEI